MPKGIWLCLLSACVLTCTGCLDYQSATVQSEAYKDFPVPPEIQYRYVRPTPKELFAPFRVGQGCTGVHFQVPPLSSPLKKATYYCMWMVDGYQWQSEVITPERRASANLWFVIDTPALTEHHILTDADYFNTKHVVELFCSDKEQTVDTVSSGYEGTSYLNWVVQLSPKSCGA